jgi:hypothetical protein
VQEQHRGLLSAPAVVYAVIADGNRQAHCWRGASPSNPNVQITYPEWIQVVANTIGPNAAAAGAPVEWQADGAVMLHAAPLMVPPVEEPEPELRSR